MNLTRLMFMFINMNFLKKSKSNLMISYSFHFFNRINDGSWTGWWPDQKFKIQKIFFLKSERAIFAN
jgi:hypothetical protein